MQEKIQSDWTKILGKEAEFEAGHEVPALELIHVLKASFVRLFYLMNEQDLQSKSVEPAALVMMGVACRLSKEFQQMMAYKSGQHWWPATTAQSLFNEV
ncbi:unnamed protein product, partial [Durusdinium trenchii]